MSKREDLNFIEVRIGNYICRCSYKIAGLTNPAIQNFNRLLAKEEQNAGKIYGIDGAASRDECGES